MTLPALVLSLLLAFAGFAALALSLDRHHRAVFRTPVPRGRIGSLRAAGWSGLGLSFAAAIASAGWSFGPVQWIGSLTGAALAVVALIAYRPRSLRAAALAALPLAALTLPLALMR
ncbi:DUF3325 domain-containing protein [Methylobacterium sp. J-030]|uniref:DUF3325 domain-containing protein n=1 Tax=Methylobacterium sp. J-030 TaxID=2836627 RepID=UPI001FBB2F71|nr:DUF3325 domain-containing protein [Methylobacterium sp. J-030]MCJ2070239.1 DUF3325 domain-containing protein [Methylobacterium sp. J-030]